MKGDQVTRVEGVFHCREHGKLTKQEDRERYYCLKCDASVSQVTSITQP